MIDPNPRDLTDSALRCAIDACARSKWFSDRQFAEACADELDRRLWREKNGPMVPQMSNGRAFSVVLTGTDRR